MQQELSLQNSFVKVLRSHGWYTTHGCIEPGFPDILSIKGDRCFLTELKDMNGYSENHLVKNVFTDRQLPWLLDFVKNGNKAYLLFSLNGEYGVYRITKTIHVRFLLECCIRELLNESTIWHDLIDVVMYVLE